MSPLILGELNRHVETKRGGGGGGERGRGVEGSIFNRYFHLSVLHLKENQCGRSVE